MRTSLVFRWFLLAVMGVVVAIWLHERVIATELSGRLAALQRQEQQLSGLRAERDRRCGEILVAMARTSSAPAAPADRAADAPVVPEAWATGEWTPVAAWKNEGRSTPRATVATLLWAAAGGDLAAVQTVLEFDDATRAKARAWFESLPPATRSLYATPEDLVAGVTTRNIPPTAAQLSWFRQTDDEHAIVGVMLAASGSSVLDPALVTEAANPSEPPSFAKPNPNPLAVLALHRTPAGWRVIVPGTAIDRMAKLLGAPAH